MLQTTADKGNSFVFLSGEYRGGHKLNRESK